jgi:hypothetical protein
VARNRSTLLRWLVDDLVRFGDILFGQQDFAVIHASIYGVRYRDRDGLGPH